MSVKRIGALPELLAPAGSFDALVAAVRAGADAVYVGGKSFGARAYAKNFDFEELSRASVYCRLHGVKLYVTLNTLIYDKEEEEFKAFVSELRRIQPSALIMADLGAIKAVRELAPELEIHASTQMSVHNTAGADEAYMLGAARVVLARELSFEDIKAVTEKCLSETEIFLHGALCVCHSGQCLMSSLVGGRSGNRGECAQPCRLPYNGKYPLSLRDLSLSNHIKELIASGVASLKIEGRMKSAEYVYTVTSIYRRLLDEGRNASSSENAELARAFSRGGFTDGYFKGDTSCSMTGVRSEDDKRDTRENEKHDFAPDKIKISAEASFMLGKPSELTLKMGDISVTAYGDVPSAAQNAPLTREGLCERLSKMGNTFFSLPREDVHISLGDGINLSPASVNALRRRAVAQLEDFGKKSYAESAEMLLCKAVTRQKKSHTALFLKPRELVRFLKKGGTASVFFEKIFVPLWRLSEAEGLANGVYIPPVITEHELPEIRKMLRTAKACGIKYALVGNLSHIALAKEFSLIPLGDFRLNVTNSKTRAVYTALGVEELILSPEATLPMARDIGGGEIVYGRIPLMLTERCFIKENFGCELCDTARLKDRTGAAFPMMREWEHRNLILNSTPTYMGDKTEELDRFNIGMRHFIFSVETAEEIANVINSYMKKKPISGARRIGIRA